MIRTYWWRPGWPARNMIGEAVNHGGPWLQVQRRHRSLRNFGDDLNKLVIEELFGESATWSSLRAADLVCVGSVLDAYVRDGSGAFVLGAGSRTGLLRPHQIDPSRVLGVRGHLTAKTLDLPPSKAIGDPGLLIRDIVSDSGHDQNDRPVLLPHFTDFDRQHRDVFRSYEEAGYRVITPNLSPLDVAEAIGGAAHLVTSSLHGMVFADALGVPVVRVTFGASGSEPTFKYRDYRSVFGLDSPSHSISTVPPGLTPELLEGAHSATAAVALRLDETIASIRNAAAGFRPAA